MRIISLLLSLLWLSGCQQFHLDHSGDDTTTLVFTSADLPAQPLICQPGEGAIETRHAVGRSGIKLIEDLNERLNKQIAVEAQVRANDALEVGFRYRDGGRTASKSRCRATVRFDARAGERYEVRLQDSSCTLSVFHLDGDSRDPWPSTPGSSSCR
jgi:hypothetical protein